MGKYDYECPVDRCGFTSRGWETKKEMQARGTAHNKEHETGEVMPEIAEVMGYGKKEGGK